MRGTWRIGNFPDEVWIIRRSGVAPPFGGQAVSASVAHGALDGWLPRGALALQVLREMAEEVGDARAGSLRADRAALLGIASAALGDGRLKAFRKTTPLSLPAKQQPGPGPNPGPSPGPQPQKTFVAIMLQTDEPTPKPVAFKRYKIELPDHTTREGMLDANGCARVEGIDPGTCKVSFPDFHKDDWQAA
jgi:hypothetical protein